MAQMAKTDYDQATQDATELVAKWRDLERLEGVPERQDREFAHEIANLIHTAVALTRQEEQAKAVAALGQLAGLPERVAALERSVNYGRGDE